MNIKEIIQDIVEGFVSPSVTFRYGWRSFQNLKADKETIFPVVYLDAPIRNDVSLKQSGYIERSYHVEIFFGNKTKLDFTPEQHDAIIVEMRELSTLFLQECQKHEDIQSVEDAKETELINVFDINISGVLLQVVLTPFSTDTFC